MLHNDYTAFFAAAARPCKMNLTYSRVKVVDFYRKKKKTGDKSFYVKRAKSGQVEPEVSFEEQRGEVVGSQENRKQVFAESLHSC